ncbi:TPA: DUF2972 domain-containing protein [Campylobacter lari]|nr:DUF2972 domain-containing protein [Campylobacter lari]
MIFKLLKLKKEYKKRMQFYHQAIEIYPDLKFNPLNKCPDYKESLILKFHLSYLIGEVILNSYKKFQFLHFYRNMQRAKEQYRLFMEYRKYICFDKINFHCIENKDVFFNKINKVNKIINRVNSYLYLKELIYLNIDFFIENIEEIEGWIFSDKFYNDYWSINYQYPPLLNPDYVDYCNISETIAWNINLPLPNKYSIVFIYSHGTGATNTLNYFMSSDLFLIDSFLMGEGDIRYYEIYRRLVYFNKKSIIALSDTIYSNLALREKFLSLLMNHVYKKYLLCQVRDPLELVKQACSRISKNTKQHLNLVKKRKFTLSDSFEDVFVSVQESFFNSKIVIMQYPTIFIYHCLFKHLKSSALEILFVDLKDIHNLNVINKLKYLSQKTKYKEPDNIEKIFQTNRYHGEAHLFLPVTLIVELDGFQINIHFLEHFDVFVSVNFLDLNVEIFNDWNKAFGIYIDSKDYELLKSKRIFQNVVNCLMDIRKKLLARLSDEKNNTLNIDHVFKFLYSNKTERIKLMNIIKLEIKEYETLCSSIIDSWKYYQKFKKICNILDK